MLTDPTRCINNSLQDYFARGPQDRPEPFKIDSIMKYDGAAIFEYMYNSPPLSYRNRP